jgi:transcriptional regulator with XRE-family HTH domain
MTRSPIEEVHDLPLTDAQLEEIRELARKEKTGLLPDLAEKWKVPTRELIRAYADARREITGEPLPQRRSSLTEEQKQVIENLALAGNAARLVSLAQDWGIDGRLLNQYYIDCRAKLRPREPLNLPVTTIQEPTPAPSPVADVRAQPGQITVLPRNWPLIQARLASGMTPRDVAIAVGIRQTDYARIEDGQQLPTDDQAAKICTLLRLRVEETFVVAAPEPLTGKGPIRGLSLLGIMRAKRRLSMKDMALQASQATGVSVGAGLIGQIERGALKQPLRPDQESQLKALAEYLAVPVEIVMAQVPPEWIQVSTAQIATLHSAMREAHAALPAPPTGELQLTAGVVET